jgi:RimJ/RimL family protein N-acetyltransferase
LLEDGLRWSKESSCHKVILEVWPHNERALDLYRSAGFVQEGHLQRHYRRKNGELWDAVVMGLAIDHDSPGRPSS